MAVSSYRKSFAFANTSNTGGKLLVLQAQDSHRNNLRAVQVRGHAHVHRHAMTATAIDPESLCCRLRSTMVFRKASGRIPAVGHGMRRSELAERAKSVCLRCWFPR